MIYRVQKEVRLEDTKKERYREKERERERKIGEVLERGVKGA